MVGGMALVLNSECAPLLASTVHSAIKPGSSSLWANFKVRDAVLVYSKFMCFVILLSQFNATLRVNF